MCWKSGRRLSQQRMWLKGWLRPPPLLPVCSNNSLLPGLNLAQLCGKKQLKDITRLKICPTKKKGQFSIRSSPFCSLCNDVFPSTGARQVMGTCSCSKIERTELPLLVALMVKDSLKKALAPPKTYLHGCSTGEAPSDFPGGRKDSF